MKFNTVHKQNNEEIGKQNVQVISFLDMMCLGI